MRYPGHADVADPLDHDEVINDTRLTVDVRSVLGVMIPVRIVKNKACG